MLHNSGEKGGINSHQHVVGTDKFKHMEKHCRIYSCKESFSAKLRQAVIHHLIGFSQTWQDERF